MDSIADHWMNDLQEGHFAHKEPMQLRVLIAQKYLTIKSGNSTKLIPC